MPLLEGKTPETIAHEIMQEIEDKLVLISGMANKDLDFLVRNKNVQIIMARGENYYEKEQESLTKNFLSNLIHNLAEAKRKYLKEKEAADQFETFRLLVSKGMSQIEASKIAYPQGVPAPKDK